MIQKYFTGQTSNSKATQSVPSNRERINLKSTTNDTKRRQAMQQHYM